MSRLYQLWSQYCECPEDEDVNEELCKQIEKHARRVLKEYKLYSINGDTYEDLIQSAFVCFFNIAPKHKQTHGSLEGFFIYSFRGDLIKKFKRPELVLFREFSDAVDWKRSPLDVLLQDELNTEIEELLNFSELKVLNTYLKEGITDYEKIAEEEGVDEEEVMWTIDSLRDKIRQHLDKEYNYYGYGSADD